MFIFPLAVFSSTNFVSLYLSVSLHVYCCQNISSFVIYLFLSLLFQQIRSNHGKDRQELEVYQTKYAELKKKVRGYQKHSRNKELHYQGELEQLRDVFTGTLLGYKAKMEQAYQSRERMVRKNDSLRTLNGFPAKNKEEDEGTATAIQFLSLKYI